MELGLGFAVLPRVFEEIAFGVGHQCILNTVQLKVAVIGDGLSLTELTHLGLLLAENEEGSVDVGNWDQLDPRDTGQSVGNVHVADPVHEVVGRGLAAIDVVPSIGIELEERHPFSGRDLNAIGISINRELRGNREVHVHVVPGVRGVGRGNEGTDRIDLIAISDRDRGHSEGIVPQARIPDHGVAADTELLGQRERGRVRERQLIASCLRYFRGFH